MREGFVILRGQDRLAVGELSAQLSRRRSPGDCHRLLRGAFSVSGLPPSLWVGRLTRRLAPMPEQREVRAFVRRAGATVALPLPPGPLQSRAAMDAYASGATIVFQKADAQVPAWSRLANAFELFTGQPAQVNLYAGPPAAQGLDWHRDPHDVLVIQLAGAKVFEVADELRGGTPVRPRALEVQSGDLLFLPRGTPHRASNGPCGSLHGSLGLLHLAGPPAALRRSTSPDEPSISTGRFETIGPQYLAPAVTYLMQWRGPHRVPGGGRRDRVRLAPDHFAALLNDGRSTWVLTRAGWHGVSDASAERLLRGSLPPLENERLFDELAAQAVAFRDIRDMIEHLQEDEQ